VKILMDPKPGGVKLKEGGARSNVQLFLKPTNLINLMSTHTQLFFLSPHTTTSEPPPHVPSPARGHAVDANHHRQCRRREPRFFLLRARLLRRTSVANQDLPPPYQPPRSGHASAMEARTPAFVGVTPAPTHPNPCLSSSAREKGVVTPSTRHHRADHTATRFENVTRSRSTVDELRIAAGEGFHSLVFLFFFLICVGLFRRI